MLLNHKSQHPSLLAMELGVVVQPHPPICLVSHHGGPILQGLRPSVILTLFYSQAPRDCGWLFWTVYYWVLIAPPFSANWVKGKVWASQRSTWSHGGHVSFSEGELLFSAYSPFVLTTEKRNVWVFQQAHCILARPKGAPSWTLPWPCSTDLGLTYARVKHHRKCIHPSFERAGILQGMCPVNWKGFGESWTCRTTHTVCLNSTQPLECLCEGRKLKDCAELAANYPFIIYGLIRVKIIFGYIWLYIH